MAADSVVKDYSGSDRARDDDLWLVDGRILYVIHELSRLVATNFDRAMARHRLTHSQWWALMHISQNPGASQTDLAQFMQMTRGAAGKLLDRLEAQHWIERRPDPTDSRVRRVYPVESGGISNTMTTEASRLYQAILGDLSRDEKVQLLAALRHMHVNAQSSLKP
jgi:MarR family transcriptional regulator for hemolysin